MDKKQSKKPQVAESPIADVFEQRDPSDAEKHWAEKTLAPTLEKAPERPIVFVKVRNSVAPPGGPVRCPAARGSADGS